MYSLAKEVAFIDPPHFDEMYILVFAFTPAIYILCIMLQFSAFFGFYMVYAILILITLCITLTNVGIRIMHYINNRGEYTDDHMTYKRGIFFTLVVSAIAICGLEINYGIVK